MALEGEPKTEQPEVSFNDAAERQPLEAYPAPRLSPESYPGDYPSNWDGYLVTEDGVIRMDYSANESLQALTSTFRPAVKVDDAEIPLDDYLISHGLEPLEARYPIIAYGSNRNPGQLIDKFSSKELADRPELRVIPAFKATLHGADVVYNAAPGNQGYFFAELYEGPETQNTSVEAAILLLTWDQLKALHATERAYEFGDLATMTATLGATIDDPEGGLEVPAYVYSGPTKIYSTAGASGQSGPIALVEVKAVGRKLTAKDQTAMQKTFFDDDPSGAKQQALVSVSGDATIVPSSQNFMKYMKMERAGGVSKLSQRKALQQQLKEAMQPDEQLAIDLRQNHGFERLTENLPALFSMAEIAIAHPRGQGWWRKIPKDV